MPARLRLAGKSACKRNRFRYRADALFPSLREKTLKTAEIWKKHLKTAEKTLNFKNKP